MSRAIDERRYEIGHPARVVLAPIGYVAGEATAAVNFINTGNALPTTTPPRMSERGVGGRPTLVQNVESLASRPSSPGSATGGTGRPAGSGPGARP